MDSLGEVGKKMRSAIKAKLLELGTGSQTGYIDDELPDYVMIMVANKRSKSQMTSDLNLFLGSNTESFVNWLHQVLQKLQEVTLPNNLASKAKKKTNDVASKKDKKKDKKNKEPSITDVIAVELMEKAKKTLELEPKVKKEGTRTPSPPPAPAITQKSPEPPSPKIHSHHTSESEKEDDEFDIPTISEIATSAGNQNLHKKELSQLQELQNRIYQTKKKLKDLESESDEGVVVGKSSVLSRLGVRKRTPPPTENSKPSSIISLSAIRRSEKEIYVAPSFRKLIERQKVENDRRVEDPRRSRITARRDRRSKSRSRSRDRQRGRRERSRSPIKRSRSPRNRPSIHQRIGSRIVVASPEKEAPIKAKHRPTLSSAITGQAGKNLLLRAVAEAQRSTAFTIEQRKKPLRDNIVVQVPLRKDKRNIRIDEEYVPESLSTQSESEAEYHPFNKTATADEGDDGDVIYLNNNEDVEFEDLDNDEPRKSPQFVVTLEGVKQFEENSKSSHSPTPPPVIKRKSIKDRIGMRTTITREERPAVTREERPKITREKRQIEEESESQRAYNRAKRARLSPIKFDLTDDEDEDERKSLNSSRELRSQTPEKMVEEKLKEELNGEKRIKLDGSRSFDHVPSLLSSITVPVVDVSKPVTKSKDRCKFYPLCSNASCAFYHPTLPCKLFPNCKFGDSCAYVHPRCKFDTSCHKVECNFSHSQASAGQTMPPIASSVVPVQNYKSISITPNTTICKFFPGCKNSNCVYLHPKLCKFGKDCINKFDCNFYHFELSSKSKFKWVSPLS